MLFKRFAIIAVFLFLPAAVSSGSGKVSLAACPSRAAKTSARRASLSCRLENLDKRKSLALHCVQREQSNLQIRALRAQSSGAARDATEDVVDDGGDGFFLSALQGLLSVPGAVRSSFRADCRFFAGCGAVQQREARAGPLFSRRLAFHFSGAPATKVVNLFVSSATPSDAFRWRGFVLPLR